MAVIYIDFKGHCPAAKRFIQGPISDLRIICHYSHVITDIFRDPSISKTVSDR